MDSTETETSSPAEHCWLDKMEGLLLWKVRGPEISTPFSTPIPDKTLCEWLGSPDSLRRAMRIKLFLEGYEVLLIKDLDSPIFETSHNSVKAMSHDQITGHMARRGIAKLVDLEMSKIQTEIRAELKRRGVKPETIQNAANRKPESTVKRKRSDITTSAMVRIIRG